MKKLRFTLLAIVAVALLTTLNASGQQGDPPEFSRSQLLDVIQVQELYNPQLLANPQVVGTGVSVDASGRGVIKVFATSAGARGVPTRLNGHPVVIEVTGPFVALQGQRARAKGGNGRGGGGGDDPDPFDTTARTRPVMIGLSTGHPDVTAGTIGAVVTNGAQAFLLSNNHVYANVNQAMFDDPVLQPGTFDGGTLADQIGTLWSYVWLDPSASCVYNDFFGLPPCNLVDAAIAEVDPAGVENTTPPDGYGVPKSDPIEPAINMRVMKYGRTTRLTQGRITSINVSSIVQYGPDYFIFLEDQIEVSGSGFSAGGDSGSLVVGVRGSDARRPVGLLFAGGGNSTLVNKITNVLSGLNVTIVGEQ